MVIIQGLVGPKAMAKAAADGQTVNIPLPPYFSNGTTESCNLSDLLDYRSWLEGVRQENPPDKPKSREKAVFGFADSNEQASKKNL